MHKQEGEEKMGEKVLEVGQTEGPGKGKQVNLLFII